MEFERVVRRRRMVRSFLDDPVPPAAVDAICDLARRAPSAGNAAAVEFLVLECAGVAEYWDATLPESRRAGFAWPGLLRAPVLVVTWTDPLAYLRRYREPDKAAAGRRLGLGSDAAAWPVPYWFADAGASVMTMLLAAADRGLGACFFGLFDREEAVRRRFGAPPGRRAVGTVALGRPAPDDRPSRSAQRERAPLGSVVHRGRWPPAGRPRRYPQAP